MSLSKRKLEDPNEYISQAKVAKMTQETVNGFITCFDVNKLFANNLISAGMCFDNSYDFLITRIRYDAGFLLLFLTGINNVQFYYRTPITLYSYKRCFHYRTPCPNKCESYKNMIVTGLKNYKCERLNVYKVDRSKCARDDSSLLDNFCSDENRIQMQLRLCEGDYIRFKNVIRVNDDGLALGPLNNVEKIKMDQVKQYTDVIVACFDLETYTNLSSFSNANIDPIITISLVVKMHDEMKMYCLINTQGNNFSLDDKVDAEVDGQIVVLPFYNEKEMIKAFFLLLWKSNPDTILDYNGDKFDLPYLVQRSKLLDIDLKFIRRYNLPPIDMNTIEVKTKFGYNFNNYFMKYFNHLDVYQFIKSSFDASKIENLKLDTVASFYLKKKKVELSVREMIDLYNKNQYAKIVKYNVIDSILPIQIFIKCKMNNKQYADASLLYMTNDDSQLTIFRKINLALFQRAINNTNESGKSDAYFFNKNELSKIMGKYSMNKRDVDDDDEEEETEGELVDLSVLGRPFVPKNQIPEDAIALCDIKTRMKYVGGKVLSPNPGYYSKTFTLDFSSLYPSIMIHFTTCLSNLFVGSDKKLYLQRNTNAITTKFLKEMSENRVLYKKEMKKHDPNSFEYKMFDSWQNAAKLVCNSQYGWFGLCCKPLANFVTSQGRMKLEEAQCILNGLNENEDIKKKWNLSQMKLKVVYGDTDSNFVSIDIKKDEFERMGGDKGLRQLISEDIMVPLNSRWNGAFKMELENIMNCMLIKGKKAYMCLKEDGSLYKRGFNVKKDSPLFLRQAFDKVIYQILTNHSLDCVLKTLVQSLAKSRNEFNASNCEEYSFSQTLNETKNGGAGESVTIAYQLYMQLRNDANTKYIPSSGDRIPYLLIDKVASKVRDRVKPTQLITENDSINWSKHIGIIKTFINDIMSMIGNDTLFVYAFELICMDMQKTQCFDILYPTIKPMTQSRIKDIMCKELNIKNKKELSDDKYNDVLKNNDQKFIHNYEFTMTKRKANYETGVHKFSTDCPACNECGVAAVEKQMTMNLITKTAESRPSRR
ncbi:DNA polymerase [Cryptophlebia leucotreta granulovirus]|uniref:DNA-directed DNA polymerase n=1 Tax=Cryptophlebia leucotreta granulosis virus TaxID=35254 RepID=Q7T5J2_GVCL|nr:DNA polymerase [Cryptophlebia leucotreta granulovirus]AAQ21696.1 DNA polymerase [Cryptophlebia leucotreta granulovirus]